MTEVRIGMDARALYGNRARGIGNYLQHLLRAMLDGSRHSFHLYHDRESGDAAVRDPSRLRERKLSIRGSRLFLWEQVALPAAARRDRLTLLHCPANVLPWWQPLPTIVTLHDVCLLRMDDGETDRVLRYWRKVMPHCVARAARIITVSEFSKQEIISTMRVPAAKIRVIRHGADPFFGRLSDEEIARLRSVHGLTEKFLLMLGADSPRKNTRRLVEAFGQLKKRNHCGHRLVVAGLQPDALQELRARVQAMSLSEEVVLLEYVDRDALRFLYSAADLFVFPSLYEGFGLPLLEAMACGAPIAASNGSSIPEVTGTAAALFDPMDTNDMRNAMERVLGDRELAVSMRASGTGRAAQFSWTKAAEETLAAYQELLSSRA